MARVILIDFDDSFTHNIAEILFKMGEEVLVIPWKKFPVEFDRLFSEKSKKVLIYGPGPGCPSDYEEIFSLINEIGDMENVFQLGICLGHQILWQLKGYKTKKCKNPVHGQSEEIEIPAWDGIFFKNDWGKKTQVQRYNSLMIQAENFPEQSENFSLKDGEVIMGRFCRGLTYQFHPESIGTSCPRFFFSPVRHFLYNDI